MRSAMAMAVVLAAGVVSGCGSSSAPAPATPEINATWTWTGMATKCSDIANATQVSIAATNAGNPMLAYEQKVACSANAGTLVLPTTGSYVIQLSLLDAMGAAIEASAPVTRDVQGPVSVTAAF